MAKGKYEQWLTDEGLTLLEGWARDGLTDEQIARNMGISRSTLKAWKKKYPTISTTLKKGKEVVDFEVENALLKNALGFEYTEETVSQQGDVLEVVKYSKPHVTAQIFWLKNRKADKWREKQEERESASDAVDDWVEGVIDEET
jgi:transcriptional regulator with XRE-family HTH domain